jgi:glycosyltransferase involved in cell wall biosynthesis
MARALARRGHDVTVACYGHGERPGHEPFRVVRVPSPPGYHALRSGPDLVKPWLDMGLAALIRRTAADVVHAHNVEALVAALASRRRPLVYNNHNLLAEELPTYFSRNARLWRRLGHAFDATVPRRADAVVAITAGAEARLRALACRRVVHVPPGVDPADFDGVTPRRAGCGNWAVYAGNLDRYQDVGLLERAMRLLPDVRLLVVTTSSGAVDGAQVVRARSWREARDWIAGADVAVLPRSLPGGFPLKLLNYAALGLRTVVCAGAAQGVPGEVVVPDGDAAAFANGVRRALALGRIRPDIEALDWDARAATIETVYAALPREARCAGS